MKSKHITIILLLLALVTVMLGIVRGRTMYKEETVVQNNELTQNSNSVKPAEKTELGNVCIITVSGNTYDVTNFKDKHEGGDVFRCGEDMTEVFKKAHGGYLKMIEKFKVN